MATDFMKLVDEYQKKKKKSNDFMQLVEEYRNTTSLSDDDIAPVIDPLEKEDRTWFQKSEGNVIQTILGSGEDLLRNIGGGLVGIGEKVVDALATVAPYVAQGQYYQNGGGFNIQADQAFNSAIAVQKEGTKEFVKKDLYDEKKVSDAIIGGTVGFANDAMGIDSEKHSVFGTKSDELAQSAGQLVGQVVANKIVPGSGMALMGLTSFGSEAEGALMNGANLDEAVLSGAISAGAEMLTEKIGGISFGGKTLTDAMFSKLSKNMTNKLAKFLITSGKVAADATAEGFEEILSGYFGAIGQKLTYMNDKEIEELFSKEDLLDSFIGGVVLGGIGGAGDAVKQTIHGVDPVSGLTKNEKAVVDKEYNNRVKEAEEGGKKLTNSEKTKIYDQVMNDMERGDISTDVIEEVLGDRKAYDALRKEAEEFKTLYETESGKLSEKQKDRLAELKAKNEANPYKTAVEAEKAKHANNVFELVKNDRLVESYNEKGKRGQAFKADLSQYDEKQRATIQSAIDSGILNNTRKTHEFVDLVARISADKGVPFDFTNNKKLKESMFAIEGKTVNGYFDSKTKRIGININSSKALNTVVGHEVTHVLEGTKLYDALSEAVKNYEISKNGLESYNKKISELESLYKGVENASAERELVSDLVGEYLFTDSDFVNRLSTENRNVFEKIFDEIKYLCKVATAGSKEARELEKVKKAFEDAYRADNKAEGGTKYSVSDTDGKQLTKEQQDFFKDSKMRDENGNLKVMYHGTPNGDFTVFKDGTYFTDNKEYADRYQNPGASSISSGKTASNPKTFEVYLDIKKPFDINDAEARRIYIEEYIKGGNAMGINPYLSDAEYDKINSIDWTEGEDLREFLIDNEYDYDGLVLDEGATGGYGDDVQRRGTSYVVFSPEQVKSIDNTKPTADKDIRFSLSEAVEETKDLMALHNLHSNELLKQLKMGGMAYPSIAITKPEMFSHDGFGEVSVILHKDAIDPKKSKYNKIYSADAYTPTFPNVDYEASEQVAANITSKVNELYDKLPEYYQRSVRSLRDYANIDDQLNRWGGEQRLVEKYADDYGMKQLYLAEKGEAVPVGKKTTENRMTDYQMKLYQTVADTIGEDVLKSFNEKGSFEKLGLARMAWLEKYGGTLKDIYAEDWSSDGTMTKEEAMEIANDQKPIYWKGEIDRALKFIETGGVTVTETDDIGATQAKIDEKIEGSDYKRWIENLFSGIEGQSGIRNSKDIFTPSGNRRSFAQTHDPLTVDNIVKAMRKENQTGQGAFGGGSILGASAKEFGSIAEVKRNAGKLGMMDKAEHDAITDKINDTFWDIARRYANGKDIINAQETIAEAVSKNESKAGIARYLKQYDYVYQYTDAIGDEIIELRDYIRNLPTPYFEAKPRRGVGFDEVAAFVIPYDSDVKLKQELLNRGYSIAEYDPKVEGDRQRVVNQFEEYKFSLSEAGETPRRYGDYNIYGKDIGVHDPLAEFAPVAENATTTEDSTAVADKTKATVSEKESVAPVVISEKETTTPVTAEEMRELFPEDVATADAELDNLTKRKAQLEERMLEMSNSGDWDKFEEVNAEYTAVYDRVAELERQIADENAQRVESFTDADAPIEREMSGGYKALTAENPFAERSETAVGNRSVKAYQYENPEVKPFFREAAYALAEDIDLSIPAERWYNDKVYYESGGEKGFGGNSRITAKDVAAFKDQWNCTWDEMREAVNDIIEDHGEENNALAKRMEFLINDRLMYGYTNIKGEFVKPSQAYLELLKEKQINEYSREAFAKFMETADQYAPEEIGPVAAESVATYSTSGMKGVLDGQRAYMPVEVQPEKLTRKVLHRNIVDNIKETFKARGFDFDKVLKAAKNLSTLATVDNTPQRVMEKALGYKEGQVLSDITVNKVAQNETAGIRWLNSFTDRKNGLLAQISKQYNIKPGSKESAAAQMYAEGFYVDEQNNIVQYGDKELAADFPNAKVQSNIKGLARDPRIRQVYDATLEAINESRARNAYPEIPRLENYFLHFRAMEDTFSRLGLPFNPNDIKAKDLPTDLNGVTADLKPGQPYFASAKHRTGKRTSFDLLGGLERYLTSAKNQIYHIDDIQTLRALRNYIADTYGQANGLDGLDALSEEEAQERIEQVYGSHLSTFAKFLNEEANVLAGKTALIDRGLEGIIGRRGMTFLDAVNKQVGSNMVGFNISSSLTNFLPVAQTFAKTDKQDFVKAFAQTASNKIGSLFGGGDDFADNSPVIIRRKGADRFYRTPWQKAADPGYVLMGVVDDISTELIARTKYNEYVRKGMDSQKAHIETDKWVSRLMGDRSMGQQPQLYNSKMLGLLTKFQLEVRNQLDSQFYDTIQEAKASNEYIENGLTRNAKTAAKVASTFFQLAVVQHLFGTAFESVAGYNPSFDIIEVLVKAFGWDDEEEEPVLDNIEEAFFALMEDMPYVSTFTGGRIPIESALPIEQLFNGTDQYGNEKSRWETLAEAAPYYLMPGGYGQLKKTVKGLDMFSDDHPVAGSYTDSGNMRFPVEATAGNVLQAAVFGQYANENARYYFDNDIAPMNEKQIKEYTSLDIPVKDYWEYRDTAQKLEKMAKEEYAARDTILQSKYLNSVGDELSDILKEEKKIQDDTKMTQAAKDAKIKDLEKRFEELSREAYTSYTDIEYDTSYKAGETYASIGDRVYKLDDDGEWRKLTDEQVEKYTITKNADNPYYATNGSIHYRKDASGDWTKISDKQLERQKEVTQSLGITPAEYWAKTDISFIPMAGGEHEYAYESPENYAVAKVLGGYDNYTTYTEALSNIESDKDENGKSISGSRKKKVYAYINSLKISAKEKMILFKSQYPSYDDKNQEIIEYLSNRSDITRDELLLILNKLGFKVDSNGKLTWD